FAFATGTGFNSHNVYGQVMGELGTTGVIAFLALLLCFLANWWEARKLARSLPQPSRDFSYQTSQALGVCLVLLLFLGVAGHNLYRYNWLWYGAFQILALHCLRQRAGVGERQSRRAPARLAYA